IAFSMNPHDTEARHQLASFPIRQKVWSVGYTPSGDDATLKGKVKALTRKYGAIFFLLKAVSAGFRLPSDTFRELSFLMSSRRKLKSFDVLVICGGGQLTEKDGPWGFPYTILKWVLLARSVGVRCIFLNVGAGPLTQASSKFLVRWALRA